MRTRKRKGSSSRRKSMAGSTDLFVWRVEELCRGRGWLLLLFGLVGRLSSGG